MPPRSGPWDTQEERRRLDAEWPWTTVIHIESSSESRGHGREIVGLRGEVRGK